MSRVPPFSLEQHRRNAARSEDLLQTDCFPAGRLLQVYTAEAQRRTQGEGRNSHE